jgi:hypothetical protein
MSNLLDSFDDHGVCARCKRYFEKKELLYWGRITYCKICEEYIESYFKLKHGDVSIWRFLRQE